MALTVAYPTTLFGISSDYPRKPPEGPLQVPLTLNFTPQSGVSGITGYTVNLANAGAQQGTGFSQLCTVFVDNSQSPGTTVLSAVGTSLSVAVPPYARGYYPIQAPNLNITIKNNSTNNCTVYIGCYNYVVNPQSDILAATTLGDQDAQVLSRVGNASTIFSLSTAATGIYPIGGFTYATPAFPYYYLTKLQLVYANIDNTLGALAQILVGDYDGASSSFVNYFGGTLATGLAQGQNAIILDLDNMALSGEYAFAVEVTAPVAGGTIFVNAIGGRSVTPLTISQFTST